MVVSQRSVRTLSDEALIGEFIKTEEELWSARRTLSMADLADPYAQEELPGRINDIKDELLRRLREAAQRS